jgi:exosortase/archaeosortase family protein
MRSLIALMALAALMAYLWKGPPFKRLLLFAVGVPLAVAANAVRIACVLLIAANWGAPAANGFFHGFSGVVVFLVAVSGLAAASWGMGLRSPHAAPA